MKHLKLFFALFAMLALGVGNAWGAELGDGYEKVTNISSLTSGDRVVVYADAISKGVTGWNSSKDATVAESGWVEYLVEVASGGVTLKDEGESKYISLTTKNTFTYADKGSVCKVNTTGVLAITLSGSDYFLYQNGTYYRMYTDKSSNNSYKPFYVYKVVADAGGDETEDLGDALKWSAATATVQMGADDNEYPTLTNDKNVDVTYSSSSTTVATIDANGVVTLVKEGTTTISAFYEGGEIEGTTYSAKTVSYTLTVKPAPLVIEPIEGGIIDILTHKTFAATSSSYANFTGKQVSNEGHSDAVYAGRSARNGNATQYSIQLNTIGTGRIATTTTGGLAKRVYVRWATQGTLNTNNRSLYIYGSNDAFTGSETTDPSTKIGTVTFTTGAEEAYADLTGDYKHILITGSGAIYMDEIQVTWVSAAGTVVTPTIHGDAEFVESTEVSISTEDGYKVYYTLDGTEPTNASTEYTAPFTVNATTTVKAVAYDGATASDVVSTTLKKLQSLTCAEAAELCTSTESADKYVIRGYVTSIPYPYSASNPAPTFWMADTKDGGEVMYAYKVSPVEEADKAVAVGDQVQVIGKIKLYSGKKEVNTGIYTITALNPKYNVNITSAHGTVTATPTSAVEGAEVTLSVEVESGWVFQSWTVTDASSNPIEVVDNKFTMPASNVTVVANYIESVAPDAVLKLSANGVVTSNTYKVGETVKLPETIVNDCVKKFVGWSVDANCATTPEYAPGADFELTAEEHTLYAVYANGTTGETVTIKHNLSSTAEAKNLTTANAANTYFNLDANEWSIIGSAGGASNNVGLNKDGTVRLYYHADGGNTLTITAPSKVATIQLDLVNNYNNAWVKVDGNKVTPVDGVYTIDAKEFVIGNAYTTNTQVRFKSITVTLAGELANFSTTCTGALAAPTFSVEAGEYTEAQSIILSAAEGTIYYTLDGTTPTSESTKYTEAIVLDECGETTIKAIAIGTESESPVASATYTLALPIPANDAENPYTGTEAIEVHHGGCYVEETLVYVTGTVQTAEYDSEYKNYKITFEDGFVCFRLQETATDKFTEDKIGAGDVIVVCGKLTDYQSKCQLAAGCYLVKHTPSVKADAELAWNPETVTLTVGDAFTAPTLVNPYSVTGITYESSKDAVATVSAEGVIALVDDAVGTATITASFPGDATYKPATVTCTIQVNPVQEDCEGSDDFETATAANASSYNTRTTDAGWEATNAAKTTLEGYTYLTINGKISTVGTITSPTLSGGIGSIKIRYANTYSEANGVSFRLDIKQNEEVVKTYTITYKTGVTQNTVYTELIENIDVAGDFQMVFTNLSPSESTSNKDRVSIGRLCWTGYKEVVEEPTTATITLVDAKDIGATLTLSADEYEVGDEITASAQIFDDGYAFAYWKEGDVIVSYSADYTFTVEGDRTLEAYFGSNMPVEMTDLAVNEDAMTITGSNAMEGIATTLVLDTYDSDMEMWSVNASESTISYYGNPLTILYSEVLLDMEAFSMAKARVVADFGGELFVFNLTMTAAGETYDVTVTETTLSMEFGALLMKGVWYNAEDEIEYPFEANIGGWDYSKAEDELIVSVTVGGWGDEDPWLGFGEGKMTLTNEEGSLTLTGEIKTNSGPVLNVTAYGQAMIMEMDVEAQLTEMEMDGVNYLNLNGTDKNSGMSVDLYLNNYTGQDKIYTLNEASTVADAISVYGDIAKSGNKYTGVAYAETGEGLYVLPMTLAEFVPTYDNINITGLTGQAEARYMGWGSEYYLALSLEGTWSVDTETYPVLLEITDGYDATATSGTMAVSLRIGGMGDDDPWLGNADGELSYTVVNNELTLSGKMENPYAEPAVYWDVNITGTILPNYTRDVTAGNFGTLCLPFGGKVKGCVAYEIVGSNARGVILSSVDALEAGVPYIFKATADQIAAYCDATVADEAGNHNGLYGTFDDNTVVDNGNYIIHENALCEVTATSWVNANRAWVVMDEVPSGEPTPMPGRKYITVEVTGENEATGVDNITTSENAVKTIVNGQLIIIRGGEKFNAMGVKL